jgi:hypothetical protein
MKNIKSVLVNNLHLDLLSPVTEDFIFSELEKLNPNKSTGLDNIPARFLKDGACVPRILDIIIKILTGL